MWLVLSGRAMHRHNLLIGSEATHATGRTHREFLFPPDDEELDVCGIDKTTRIDVQAIWTFPTERDATDRIPIPSLAEEVLIARLNARLRKQLTRPVSCDAAPLGVGSVVWVRLRGDASDWRSDLHAVQLYLRDTYASPWTPSSDSLPALVIAASAHERSVGSLTLPLITVVPILVLPAFQQRYPSNPTVTIGNLTYSALTQVLMTIDYEARGRVLLEDGEQHTWSASPAEVAAIRKELLLHMGIRQ